MHIGGIKTCHLLLHSVSTAISYICLNYYYGVHQIKEKLHFQPSTYRVCE